MLHTGESIAELFEHHVKEACAALRGLAWVNPVGTEFGSLHGWVFEQTVRAALANELVELGVSLPIRTQVPIAGRAKADLAIGDMALELKSRGLFGQSDVERYAKYARQAKARGFRYAFVTLSESHQPYRAAILAALGTETVFFLDTEGEWERLVRLVASALPHERAAASIEREWLYWCRQTRGWT